MRVDTEFLKSSCYQMVVLALHVDDRYNGQAYSNSIVAGGLGVMS